MTWLKLLVMVVGMIIICDAIGKIMASRKEKRQRKWVNIKRENGEVHTIPNMDLMLHLAEDCPCKPVTHPVPRDDGSMGWQVVHNAKDGRE